VALADYDVNGQAVGAIHSGPPPIRLSAERLAGGGFVKLLDPHPTRVGRFFQLYAADGAPTEPAKLLTDKPGRDLDVFTQRLIEVPSRDQAALRAKRKACLAGAQGITGQERKAFMDACMAA
jgi:hypothetical protein